MEVNLLWKEEALWLLELSFRGQFIILQFKGIIALITVQMKHGLIKTTQFGRTLQEREASESLQGKGAGLLYATQDQQEQVLILTETK